MIAPCHHGRQLVSDRVFLSRHSAENHEGWIQSFHMYGMNVVKILLILAMSHTTRMIL
ncbi:hypothetical protein B0O80DRAFT_461906, partial [Mortierella sp. GBAus27b]